MVRLPLTVAFDFQLHTLSILDKSSLTTLTLVTLVTLTFEQQVSARECLVAP